MKKAQKIRLGIFLFVGLVFLFILVGYFTARTLFERKDHYYVAYRDVSVSGLEVGSPVKFLGINVGSIVEIGIDPNDVNTIIVRLALQEDTPVKTDAVADIVAMGITGLKTIEIKGGTQEADFLDPEGYIRQGSSLADDFTGQAEVIAFKVEQVLNNLQDFTQPEKMDVYRETARNISSLAEQTGLVVDRLDQVIAENRDGMRETIDMVNRLVHSMDGTSRELHAGISRFNEIMQGDTLSQVLGNFRDISVTLNETNLNELIESLAEATSHTQRLLLKLGEDLDRGGEGLTENLQLLQNTLNNLHDISRKVSTNPSALIRRPDVRGTPDRNLIDP